jgi:threonylcarbamoyladenosine tRNA methylthiotransferase MtaB
MRVYLTTVGCKLNQAETEALSRELRGAGHEVVDRLEIADAHVVNSCAVTHVAARDSRKAARRGARGSPGVQTLVTGCLATIDPQQLMPLEGVARVVPNSRKRTVLAELEELVDDSRPATEELGTTGARVSHSGPSRAALKIQDGCGMRCAYCVVPRARGVPSSVPLPEILREARVLEGLGIQEVVLTGVQISSYGWEGLGLEDVALKLLDETGIGRFRLSSLAPWQLTEKTLELFQDRRLCRHLHLSLQSGCDETLRRMRRPYTSRSFDKTMKAVRAAIPGVSVTTDVIVAFPGESRDDFQASLRFVERMGFGRIHVFPYSSRPETEAAGLSDAIPQSAVKERMTAMLDVARSSERRFQQSCLGQNVQVLWERRRQGTWQGTTDHYLKVHTRDDIGGTEGTLGQAQVIDIRGDLVWAQVLGG